MSNRNKVKADAFDTYVIYNAIKLTYDDSSSYDWFKYGGGIKNNKESFLKRKDKNHYYVIAKKCDHDVDIIADFFFVTLYNDPTVWPGKIENPDVWESFKKYKENFKVNFTNEIVQLMKYMKVSEISTLEALSSQQDTPPKLMEFIYSGQFTPMMFHGINRGIKLLDSWLKHEKVFEPFLDKPMKRLETFDKFVRKYSDYLTDREFSDILLQTLMREHLVH